MICQSPTLSSVSTALNSPIFSILTSIHPFFSNRLLIQLFFFPPASDPLSFLWSPTWCDEEVKTGEEWADKQSGLWISTHSFSSPRPWHAACHQFNLFSIHGSQFNLFSLPGGVFWSGGMPVGRACSRKCTNSCMTLPHLLRFSACRLCNIYGQQTDCTTIYCGLESFCKKCVRGFHNFAHFGISD